MKPAKKPQGEIRQSQLITTFGPGSMVDLPNYSVLVSGLEFWSLGGETISEPRLTGKLARVLDVNSVELRTPPPANDDLGAAATGITGFQFPEWFITQGLEDSKGSAVRTRLLVHRKALTKGKYIDRDKKKKVVVPIRFVRACRAGHINDIDWYAFAHNGLSDCAKQGRQLFIDERGTSGDLTEVWIRCECGKAERSMAQAAIMANRALGSCDGSRIWLGPYTKETCGEPNRLLIRSASNAYFPQTMSVISLPDRDDTVRRAIDAVWSYVEAVETIDELKYERKKAAVKAGLEGISDDEAFAEIQGRRLGGAKADKPVKFAELETLIASKDEVGEDRPEGIFYARALPRTLWERPWMQQIERVVLVHRLREVVAQVAFTRFEAAAPDIEGELDIGVRRASLAREVSWLPAFENKGEGIFLQFKTKAISDWLQLPDVQARSTKLGTGFSEWRKEHQGTNSRISRGCLPDASLVLTSPDYGTLFELRLSSQLDPRTRVCDPECWVWSVALHRNIRRRRDARRTAAGGSENPRGGQSRIGFGDALLQ